MNKESKEKLKKSGILSGFFLTLILTLWGTSYLGYTLKEDIYIKTAENIFANSPLCSGMNNIRILKGSSKKTAIPNFCNAVFNAENNGNKIRIMFINMTGKYGTYQGLFIYEKEKSGENMTKPIIKFCGLAGNIDLNKQPAYYGITPLIINAIQRKIEKKIFNIEKALK